MLFKLSYKSIALITLLLSTGAFVQAMQQDNIHEAAGRGDVEAVRRFLARDPELLNQNLLDWTPLHYAADKGHEGVVRLLLAQPGIQINTQNNDGKAPLHCAVYDGNEEVVRLLLEHNAKVNQPDNYGRTPLHCAAECRNKEVVHLLLAQQGIQINQPDNFGATPLHYAAISDNKGVVRLLLAQQGIQVNTQNDNGIASLHFAAWYGYEEVVNLLLAKQGIQINAPDNFGATPLHYAAYYGNEGVARLLLAQQGIQVNQQDNDGKTPLHDAAQYGPCSGHDYKAVIRLLLEHGANPTVSDHEHKIPFDYPFVQTIYAELSMRAARLAVCMVLHPRTGAQSPLLTFPHYNIRQIVEYLQPEHFLPIAPATPTMPQQLIATAQNILSNHRVQVAATVITAVGFVAWRLLHR